MYKLFTVEDTVRIPPKRFGEDLNDVIISEYENAVIGKIEKEIGIVLAVTDVRDIGGGKIIMGDGAVYYDAVFEILVYLPIINEVVEGRVTEITEFGAFVNFGPIDGLIHVSQLTEDFMSYDQKNSMLVGKETKRILKQGDMVRARIITVSLKDRLSESKIGLTMRQPYLGKVEWLVEEKKTPKTERVQIKKHKKEPRMGERPKGRREK